MWIGVGCLDPPRLRHDPGMAVIWVAWQCHGIQGELSALAALEGLSDRDLYSELVMRIRLALTDTRHLVGMQRIDLAAALTLPLLHDRLALIERPFEDRIQVPRRHRSGA